MSIKEIRLSEYGYASSTPSPVNRMMAQFASDFRDGIDINLGVGYVNERTIPARQIVEALHGVLAEPDRHRFPFNYGGARGSPNLVGAIRRYLAAERGGGLPDSVLERCDVVIGPSGATSLLEGLARVLGPGLVVTADPMYYIFCECLQRQGFELLAIPEDRDGIRVDLLEEAVRALGEGRNRISFFYVVTVSNPTCTILSNDRRRRLVEEATRLSRELGRKIPIVFDRAYEDLVHDPSAAAPSSALPYDELGIVYEIGTLSKVLAPALRIGYMVGRPSPFVEAMVQKTSDTGFSASLAAQEIAGRMLDRDIADHLDFVRREYRKKALAVREWIDKYLGDEVEDCRGGQAGFYYYITLRRTETHEGSGFFRFLSRTTGDPAADGPAGNKKPRVVYLPGSYCVHPSGAMVDVGRRQLRLSYGFEELPRIRAALSLMGEALKWLKHTRP